ncbi:MAG: ABC transporter ATP-binding protein, partial [Pseudonocardiaceae bacterium]
YDAGDLAARATSDSNLLRTAATTGLVQLTDGALSFVATFVLMSFLDLRLTVVTAVVLGIAATVVGVVLPRIRASVVRGQAAVGALGAALDRSLGAARTVKANAAEARETARIDAASERGYRAGLTGARYTALIDVLTELSLQASFLAVLGLGGALVASGSLPVSTLVAFLLALFYLTAPIESLTAGATDIQQGLGALTRLREVSNLTVEDDVDEPALPVTIPRRPAPEIRIEDLTFAYSDRDPVLRGVTLVVPARSLTALVGPSGAGKSTLFALLQRFYEPDSGTIALDGRDISSISRAALRARLAWVDQDSAALSGTVAENLRFGAPGADDDALFAALRAVRLDNLVEGFPDGLHTSVGGRGATISGGQRQRLAVARALLRGPQVLLLDEATSQLDTVNELALRETIQDISRQATVLVIAHRMATVAAADRIVVLD